ncbi:MAG: hypothetical protein IGS48_02465 [Oscillatoriales cyanobacterium C42_A2020_001]|nr:hypothetical protein [Leptolyngbyaceae cyanobacterium C42_A2020_001]
MTTDESLSILLKLVNGNKEECYQRVETVREAYPGKSMQWCIEKAIYDLRFGKKSIKPNATLSRWGEGGGTFNSSPTSSKPASQPVATPSKTTKPALQLPPPPPPNSALSSPTQPKQETLFAPSLPDLAALARAKRQTVVRQPANESTKQKLFTLAGNRAVAMRLVERIQTANPDRSEQWVYEKAIYDLERDRL